MIVAIRFNGIGISAFGSMVTGGVSAFPRNAVGFINALERKLSAQNLSLGKDRRVAIGVENYQKHMGEKNHSSPKMALPRPWKKQGDIAGSVLDYEWKCNATVTLILSSIGGSNAEFLQDALVSIIPSMRFANGSIFVRDGFVKVVGGSDQESLDKAAKAVKASRASFFVSRNDLIKDADEFNSFVNALALFDVSENAAAEESSDSVDETESDDVSEGNEAKVSKWKRNGPGWIVPVERGYSAVTEPVIGRPAARHPTIPTIVVTPVVGLAEFVTFKTFSSEEGLNLNAFWKAESDRTAGFYLFNATSFN